MTNDLHHLCFLGPAVAIPLDLVREKLRAAIIKRRGPLDLEREITDRGRLMCKVKTTLQQG